MPSTSFRAGNRIDSGERPLAASVAAAFGALMTAEMLFFGALFVVPEARLDRVTVAIGVLALGGAAATLMVVQGRRGGAILLAVTAVGVLAAVLMMVLVLAALGATGPMWGAVLLTVGPLGCLVLAPQRSVREWAGLRPTRRTAGGRRGPGASH